MTEEHYVTRQAFLRRLLDCLNNGPVRIAYARPGERDWVMLHDRLVGRIDGTLRLMVRAEGDDSGRPKTIGLAVVNRLRGTIDTTWLPATGIAVAILADQIEDYAATWKETWKP